MNAQAEYVGHGFEGPDTFTDVSTLGAIPNAPGQMSPCDILISQVGDTYQHLMIIGPPIHIQSDLATFVLDEDEHAGGDFIVYSPFDYLDDENYEAAIQIIEDVTYLHRTDSEKIRDRLSELLELSIEDIDQRVMSAHSLQFFIDFLRAYNQIRSPLIFMLESGDIRSEWRVSGRQVLAVEFASDGTVEYIVFAPNSRRQTQTVIQSGDRIAWQDLIPTLQQCADMKWIWDPNDENSR